MLERSGTDDLNNQLARIRVRTFNKVCIQYRFDKNVVLLFENDKQSQMILKYNLKSCVFTFDKNILEMSIAHFQI